MGKLTPRFHLNNTGAHIEESRSKLHYKQRKQRRAAEDAQRKYDAKSAAQLRRSRKINEVNFQSQLNASGTSKRYVSFVKNIRSSTVFEYCF